MKKFGVFSFIVVGAIVIVALVFLLRPSWQIGGDGYGYYMYLRSFVFDHDFDFKNDYAAFDLVYGAHQSTNITLRGRVSNEFAVGESILVAPFFAVAYLIDTGHQIDNVYHLSGLNGYYQVAIFFAASFYFLLGLFFVLKTLKIFFSEKVAMVATALILATPLIFYLIYEPSMAHVFSFFALSGLIYFSLKNRQGPTIKTWLIVGFWLGLAALIRWQNILAGILPLALIFFSVRPVKKTLAAAGTILFTAAVVFLPQIFIWLSLFGTIIAVPQGKAFFHFWRPEIFSFLFSANHGLFFWHPIFLLSIIGLFLFYRREKILGTILVIILLVQIYLNSSLADWMGGRAFGRRRLADYFPIFALGLAAILERGINKKLGKIFLYCIMGLAVIWNIILMILCSRGIIDLNGPLHFFRG